MQKVGTESYDFIRGTEDSDLILGLGWADILIGMGGADNIFGGEGDDKIILGEDEEGYQANVPFGKNKGYGEQGDDIIFGTDFADELYGGGDDDILVGNGGNDLIDGGSGDRDMVSYQNATGGVEVILADGLSRGADGEDTIVNVEGIIGSRYRDHLIGDDGQNQIEGGAGNDGIDGLGGDDHLFGQEGDDWIYGGAGRDMVNGGAGSDVLFGGEDEDTFAFKGDFGYDVIKDWESGVDTLYFAAQEQNVSVQVVNGGGHAGLIVSGDINGVILIENAGWIINADDFSFIGV